MIRLDRGANLATGSESTVPMMQSKSPTALGPPAQLKQRKPSTAPNHQPPMASRQTQI
jgi:hypothetical protein